MSGTTVLQCSCKHEQQDKLYGNRMRLHNLSADKTKAYCTVCCIRIDPKTGRPAINNLGKNIKDYKTVKR